MILILFSKVRKHNILILMKNNDCLFSDIQNLCNAVSDWLIKQINNPIETKETVSCAWVHIYTCVITAEPVKFRGLILFLYKCDFKITHEGRDTR